MPQFSLKKRLLIKLQLIKSKLLQIVFKYFWLSTDETDYYKSNILLCCEHTALQERVWLCSREGWLT